MSDATTTKVLEELDRIIDLIAAVDQLLNVLDDYPETADSLTTQHPRVMWAVDRIREARFASKQQP